jgi:hypothetical protein
LGKLETDTEPVSKSPRSTLVDAQTKGEVLQAA